MTSNHGWQVERESRGGGTVVSTANFQREISQSKFRKDLIRKVGLGVALLTAVALESGCGPMIKAENRMTGWEANYVVILKPKLKEDGITTSAWDYYIPLRNRFKKAQSDGLLPPYVNDPVKFYDWLKEQEAKQRSSSEEKRQ